MYRYSTIVILIYGLAMTACAAGSRESRAQSSRPLDQSAYPNTKQRYEDTTVGFPILPFELSEQTGIAPPDFRIVPEEQGFWQAATGIERRWAVERRDGNLVAFHEDDTRIRFATFQLNEGPHGNAFELIGATLFGPEGRPLVTFTVERPLPDLAREWTGKFETAYRLESKTTAPSYEGELSVTRTPEAVTVQFFRENMLSGRPPLFVVELKRAADGSFVLKRD